MFIDDRLFHWLMGNDTGISSRTIASAITGMQLSENYDIPYDPSDFGRCYRLLKKIPEWQELMMHKVVIAFPYWKPFIDHWKEMEQLYEKELPSGVAPILYKLMQQLVEEANIIKIKNK